MSMVKEKKELYILDGSILECGKWYNSKRGHLILCKNLMNNGTALVISHITGNVLRLSAKQISYFTLAKDPGTQCGTMIIGDNTSSKISKIISVDEYEHIYSKYKHVVVGSIYRMKNINSNNNMSINMKEVCNKKSYRKKIKTIMKGQVRCKILCKCGNERDIKVQDAFQVKECLECKNKRNKVSFSKFINSKKKVSKKK